MTVMGRTLWDRSLEFDPIADDYFRAAFGRDGPAVKQFLAGLSRAFDPRLLRAELGEADRRKAPSKLKAIPPLVARLRPLVARGMVSADACHAASWTVLDAHLDLCLQLCKALVALCSDRAEEARELARELFDSACRRERTLHPVFDVFEFQLTLAPLFGIERAEIPGM